MKESVDKTKQQSRVIQGTGTNQKKEFVDNRLHNPIHVNSINDTIQARQSNPDPAPSTDENLAGVTLSEHHIVPYSILEEFINLYRNKNTRNIDGEDVDAPNPVYVNFRNFLPKEETMDSTKLKNAGIISMEAKEMLDYKRLSPQNWLLLDDSIKMEHIAELDRNDYSKRRIKRELDSWSNTMKATSKGIEFNGVEPDVDLLNKFLLWSKGNLFVGPEGAKRTWDPKDGFDLWAESFIPSERYEILKTIFNNISLAIAELKQEAPNMKNDNIQAVVTNLQTIATEHNNAIPFDHTKWQESLTLKFCNKYKPIGKDDHPLR